MNKQDFLKALRTELERRKVGQIEDIMADYEEHFTHGKERGKTEEEISQKLGAPSVIAKSYETETLITQVKNSQERFKPSLALDVIGRLIVIAPFNFIVLFIPGVVIFSLLVAGWSCVLGLIGAGFGVMGFTPVIALGLSGFWPWLAGLSTGLGVVGMGVTTGILMFWITKYILLGLISYLQWNLKFISPAR